MLWPDPAQRPRIVEIRDNLIARIGEAEHQGWLGEVEGLKTSLAGANDKLAQIDRCGRRLPVDLGIPRDPVRTLARFRHHYAECRSSENHILPQPAVLPAQLGQLPPQLLPSGYSGPRWPPSSSWRETGSGGP
jgi:hypothetical protein